MSRNTSRDHTQQLDPGIEPAIVVERILRVSERQQNFEATDHCCCAFGKHPAPQRRNRVRLMARLAQSRGRRRPLGPRSNACREQQVSRARFHSVEKSQSLSVCRTAFWHDANDIDSTSYILNERDLYFREAAVLVTGHKPG